MQSNRTIDKLCSPCGRHSKYLTPQQRKVYCMRDQTGNFCGTALMTYFGTSGTLSSAPDCAGLDVTTPGTCTDKCTAYLRDVVEQSGCCLTTAFNAAVSLAGSAKEVAAALKREVRSQSALWGLDGPSETLPSGIITSQTVRSKCNRRVPYRTRQWCNLSCRSMASSTSTH